MRGLTFWKGVLFACVLTSLAFHVQAANTDYWFLVCSDCHYTATDTDNTAEHNNVARMNAITGKTFFDGTTIGDPLGVLALGDLADNVTLPMWQAWLADFGLNGKDGVLKYPVYEGWGNHDVQGLSSYTKSPILKKQTGSTTNGIYERNPSRIFVWHGVTNTVRLASQGYVYSWEWGPVLFIQAGYSPCDMPLDPNRTSMGGVNYDPTGSLQFVRDELARIGTTGQPIILMHHLDVNSTFGWTQAEIDKYYDVVKDYNVIAVMYGHTTTAVTTWKTVAGGAVDRSPSIHTVNTGNLGAGFWVAHVTDTNFSIAYTTGQSGGQPTWSGSYRGSWPINVPQAYRESAVSVSAGSGGTVEPAGTVYVRNGSSTNFTVRASPYWHVTQVRTNSAGVSLTGTSEMSHTWSNISADGTFAASFAANLATNDVPEWWLAANGWTSNFNSAALTDSDNDGLPNWAEYFSSTSPTNKASVLKMEQPALAPTGVLLRWDSVAGKTYRIERGTIPGQFTETVLTGIAATPPINEVTIPFPADGNPRFYRVRLE